jgi:hypothetical protein
VHFVDLDEDLVRVIGRFFREGFDAGATCIAIVTREHRVRIDAHLESRDFNPEKLAAAYRYIPLDADTTLASFMSGDLLDRERFHRSSRLLLAQAASLGAPVRIFGEMVTLLAERGLNHTALQLEELWNDLSREYAFTLLCCYRRTLFTGEHYKNVCAVHSDVLLTA